MMLAGVGAPGPLSAAEFNVRLPDPDVITQVTVRV